MGLSDWVRDHVLGQKAKEISEGKDGPVIEKIYWWLAGKKTATGAALEVALLGLHRLGLGTPYDDNVLLAAHLLMVVGLLDKAWRSDPVQIPEAWKDLYASAVKIAPATGLLVGLGLSWLQDHYCPGGTCPGWETWIEKAAWAASALGLVGNLNARKGPAR